MAAGDLILSDGKTMTPEDLQKIAVYVTELINTNAKDPGQWELAGSLEGVTSLPVFQVIGATYKLVRVAVETLRGVDGREVELMVNQDKTYIQWRYTDDMWNNLIAIADLKGVPGETPEFCKGETGVEWKYQSEIEWNTLIPFSELKWDFSDLTPEQIEQLWENLPEHIIAEFQQPATEAAQLANEATQATKTATEAANTAAENANQEATKATKATNAANDAIGKAETATQTANTAAEAANTAAEAANSATSAAQTATEGANTATNAATEATEAAHLATSEAKNATSAAQQATSAAQSATEAAKTATGAANSAAESATNAAGTADSAATAATGAAESANSAAQAATTATREANTATQNANTAAESANTATENANTATSAAQQAKVEADAAAKRANDAAEAAEGVLTGIRPDWLAGKESGNYIKNKPEIITLAAAPTEDTLSYINTDETEVSFKIGDLVRFFDTKNAGDYVFHQLYDIVEGKAKWKLAGGGEDAPSDGKKYVRQNKEWVVETQVDLSPYLKTETAAKTYQKIGNYITYKPYIKE